MGGAGMNEAISVRAKCPFFRAAKKQYIHCEGLEHGQRVELNFKRKTKHSAWVERYCCSYRYEQCPLYQALEQNCKEA